MKKSKKDKKEFLFLKNIRLKYRISFLDESTLEEVHRIRISPLFVFLYIGSFLVITFALLTILIFTTPIRYYLPGYGYEGDREHVIADLMRADSIQNQVNRQEKYIESIKDIISGNIKVEEINPLDSFILVDPVTDLNLDKSKAETDFTEKFEDEEKYNLSSIKEVKKSDDDDIFLAPTTGIIDRRYNEADKFYGLSIISPPNQTVLSIQQGTVIYADYSFENEWIIQVQHNNNYISIYKNNIRLLKKVGAVVSAGESIAITGDKNNKDKNFIFEVWHKGSPVNPENIIVFN